MYKVMERYVQHISDHEDDFKTIRLLEEHFTALQLESDFLAQKYLRLEHASNSDLILTSFDIDSTH